VDWGNVAAGAITGIVGLAGIAGTTWQAKRGREAQAADLKASLDAAAGNLRLGIDAESERARLAEKRRVYGQYLTALSEMFTAAGVVKAAGSTGDEGAKLAATAAQLSAANGLAALFSEIELVSPYEVRLVANHARHAAHDFSPDDQRPFGYGEARANLVWAMRDDLGEPGPEEEHGPAPDQGQPG